MPYKVTVAAGLDNVILAGRGPFTAGDEVLLTDEEFVALRPDAFGTLFTGAPAPVDLSTAVDPYA